MAFPGIYNISYYKGDTLKFRIYPKDSNGDAYNLTPYLNNTVTFAFAESRGGPSQPGYHRCYSIISDTGGYIECTIRPEDSSYLDPTKTYVYDVQISKSGDNFPEISTVLTGNITIQDQVSATSGVSATTYGVVYVAGTDVFGETPKDDNRYAKNDSLVILSKGLLYKNGYSFVGWTKTSDGTGVIYNPGDYYPVGSSDINFYSKWEADSHTVNFNANSGTSVLPLSFSTDGNIVNSLGNNITSDPETTRSGYIFDGWYTTDELLEQVVWPYAPGGLSDITIYAKWLLTVTYDGNGNDDGAIPSVTTHEVGSTVTVSPNVSLVKSGFVFAGWNTSADGTGTTYQSGDTFILNTPETLYAKWVAE
jgi:uncharacterized repeat protein (TIGR02543 family)